LKNKGLKEEIVAKIGLYNLIKSTTLESNKSLVSVEKPRAGRKKPILSHKV
jgi:hypothetical protein